MSYHCQMDIFYWTPILNMILLYNGVSITIFRLNICTELKTKNILTHSLSIKKKNLWLLPESYIHIKYIKPYIFVIRTIQWNLSTKIQIILGLKCQKTVFTEKFGEVYFYYRDWITQLQLSHVSTCIITKNNIEILIFL